MQALEAGEDERGTVRLGREKHGEVTMNTVQEKELNPGEPERPAMPPFPATTGELINTLAHFHRAEIARMAGWRDRIDRTTNWAITVVAGMLSVSLSTATAHHGVLLFAMILVLLLLLIEARRYRFFDVYRVRVRQLERHYFAQVFAPEPGVDRTWMQGLGQDLRRPQFLMSMKTAMSRRLRRNYFWIFLILLLAWVLKVSSATLHPVAGQLEFAQSALDMVPTFALGPVPGWVVLLAVAMFYIWLTYATFTTTADAGELTHGEVHV
jgi:uncharacterized membrane protein